MASPPLYIVGGGAVGLHLAARLHALAPVTLLARGQRVALLSRDGFDLTGSEQGHFHVPVRDIRTRIPADADVILAVKATQLAPTLAELRMRPGQVLALCPGGLGVANLVRSAVPHSGLVRVAGWLGVVLISPLAVRVNGPISLELAADNPGILPTRDRWRDLLQAAGYTVTTHDDGIAACEWRTSLWLLAVAGLCAALGERNGAVLDSPPLHAVSRALLDEARAVAAADGVILDDAAIERVFSDTQAYRDNRGPLLQDLLRGVATEMPFLNAEVARRAGAHGVPALVNAVIARLVEHCERRPQPADTSQPAT
jgi:2-dehydropantoate 2-reductase